jgi:nucleoid-associated protein YgaU
LLQYIDSADPEKSAKHFITDNAGQVVQTIAALGGDDIVPGNLGKVYSGIQLDATPPNLSTTSRPSTPSVIPADPLRDSTKTTTSSRVSVRNLIAHGDNLGSLTTTHQRVSIPHGGGFHTTGGGSSTFKAYSDIASAVPDPASANGQTYVVKPEDTLRNLARSFYGDANLW